MKKKSLILILAIGVLIATFLVVFPKIEFTTEYKFIACRYSDDTSEFENEVADNGNYAYYEKRDISVSNYDIRKFLCFHIMIMDYEDGNYCETQFLLDESYINAFIEFAIIEYSSENVDVAQLIEGKRPIMGNIQYPYQEDAVRLEYDLEGDEATMFIYEVDDLLVFQVDYPYEGSHYIAYK